MGVIPIHGVERVSSSCSISRAAFMKMILVSVSIDIIFYSTEVLASLTRRGTSHDQFYVRFPYTHFSRHVAFPTRLNTVETRRNRQRLTDTRVGDVARVTDRQIRTRILKGWVVDARTALSRNHRTHFFGLVLFRNTIFFWPPAAIISIRRPTPYTKVQESFRREIERIFLV